MAVGQFRDKEAHAYTTEHETDRYSDPIGVLVKPKWRGTEQDKTDMDVLGRGQVLRRNFKLLSALAFGSTLICTWEIMLA
ncbi:MAG: hypothetical protein LQ344_005120 [Seirophora lacunosa]|nr:MAG: hypothetical protein LQ344_005120 [Seirophora lacunosa]